MLSDLQRLRSRIRDFFPDRELYVRSNGRVRFLRISQRFQLRVASLAAAALALWLAISGTMLVSQAEVAAKQAAVARQARVVAATETRVDAYRATIDSKADALEARQAFLETLASQYFGDKPKAAPTKPATAAESDDTTALVPGASRLDALETAQLAFAERVTEDANARAALAEGTMRRLGLSPQRLAGVTQGVGGPFVAFGGKAGGALSDMRFRRLAVALERLDRMERAVLAVPSFRPAPDGRLTSSFGFRFDPFTRWPAMHQGQDFSGARGAPIHAAAPGRVVRAGWWAGYGRAVEIDHGRGLRTRYGHMSRLEVRAGERIQRGARIGRMGSTGRSTGTHLHFEVRQDGRAVNPRPFLEASADVLEIQGTVRKRIGGVNGAARGR